MRTFFSVLLALSYITLSNPLMASNNDDDNDAAPAVSTSHSRNTQRAPYSHSLINGPTARSFSLDAFLSSRELGLFESMQMRYRQTMEDLAQQTGKPVLFMKEHIASYVNLTLAELEELVRNKTLEGTLDPTTEHGQNYFKLKELLKDTSVTGVRFGYLGLRLCPPFRDATHLIKIELEHNQLIALPGLSALTNLQNIDLAQNQLTALPDLIALINLQSLDLSANQFTALPDLSVLINLRWLYLSANQLTALSDLSTLTNLVRLVLRNNQLTVLPDLSALTNLRWLYLQDNQLTPLPDLSTLTNLQELSLFNNHLTALPDLSALTNLQELSLFNNHLTALPDLSALTNLQELSLFNNHLTALPDLSALTNLRGLYLDKIQANQVGVLRPLMALIDQQKEQKTALVSVKEDTINIPEETLRERLAKLSGEGQTQVEQ